jgi:uncharacterized protein
MDVTQQGQGSERARRDQPGAQRRKVRFRSGDDACAAWHYPGSNGACVVMAGGFGVTKEPGTDKFAKRFHEAGFSVLAMDYRGIGESGGRPRQVQRVSDGMEDWRSAVAHAAALPEVDPARVAVWGFSSSGGYVFRIGAEVPGVAAGIAQTPNVDNMAVARAASRYQRPGAALRTLGRLVADALGSLVGRPPLLIPLGGEPGTVAVVTTPDTVDGPRALNPGNRYPDWVQAAAGRSVLRMMLWRPGRYAPRVSIPLLVLVCDNDRTALVEPSVRAAQAAPHGELVRLPGGHYEPFLGGHEAAVAAEVDFLRRHLLGDRAPQTR